MKSSYGCSFEKDLGRAFPSSFFPFTEPSAESRYAVRDVQWSRLPCVQTNRLVEIMGLRHGAQCTAHVGIDPENFKALPLVMGLSALAMLRYGVNDLRLFFDNDPTFFYLSFARSIPFRV